MSHKPNLFDGYAPTRVGRRQVNQLALARQLIRGVTDQRFDYCSAAAEKSTQSVAGKQILPGILKFLFLDTQHRAGYKGHC
jgi:hypothetical protein